MDTIAVLVRLCKPILKNRLRREVWNFVLNLFQIHQNSLLIRSIGFVLVAIYFLAMIIECVSFTDSRGILLHGSKRAKSMVIPS